MNTSNLIIDIENLLYSVYVTNGDCAFVENIEDAEEVQTILKESIVEEVTDEDEFAEANEKLDFGERVSARRIFRFRHPNPNNSGYICFVEDYRN